MTVEVSTNLIEALRRLATKEGRDIDSLVEEAVRDYLQAAAITDVDPNEVGQTQVELAPELAELPPYDDGQDRSGHAAG